MCRNIAKIKIILKHEDNGLVLSWKIDFKNMFFQMTFNNVSRFRIEDVSNPLEIHGFEIINHSQNGWDKDSTYEVRDFEDDHINFFCEYFTMDE